MKTALPRKLLALCVAIAALVCVPAPSVSARDVSAFRYELIEDDYNPDLRAVRISGYDGVIDGELVIPEQIGDHPVRVIGDAAFADRADITSVSLPETLYTVESRAFANCADLTDLTIGDAVVRKQAFSGCNALQTVRLNAYKAHFEPDAAWNADGNDALIAAELDWLHYHNCVEYEKTIPFAPLLKKIPLRLPDALSQKAARCLGSSTVTGRYIKEGGSWMENTEYLRFFQPGSVQSSVDVIDENGDVIVYATFDVRSHLTLLNMIENLFSFVR